MGSLRWRQALLDSSPSGKRVNSETTLPDHPGYFASTQRAVLQAITLLPRTGVRAKRTRACVVTGAIGCAKQTMYTGRTTGPVAVAML